MNALTLPTNRDEAWRWSDLSALPTFAARQPSASVSASFDLWLDCPVPGPRLLFVAGRLAAEQSDLGSIDIGTIQHDAGDHALARQLEREGYGSLAA